MHSILNTIFTEKLFPFMVLFGVTNRNKLMFFLIFSLTLFKQLMWSLKRFSETPILQSRMPKGISKCYHPINERKLFLPSSVPSNLNFVIVVFKYENEIFSFNIYSKTFSCSRCLCWVSSAFLCFSYSAKRWRSISCLNENISN